MLDQIATIGDTVYSFGELGMQEIESSKFVKGVLESIGFTVETGNRRHEHQCLGALGHRQAADRDRHGNRCAAGRLAGNP